MPPPVEPIEAEDAYDLRDAGRLAAWAGAAALALLVAFLAARSDAGWRRLQAGFGASGSGPRQASPPPPAPTARAEGMEAEQRRLAEHVSRLTADRDQLLARLAAVERSLEVTGSLGGTAGPTGGPAVKGAGMPAAPVAAAPPNAVAVPAPAVAGGASPATLGPAPAAAKADRLDARPGSERPAQPGPATARAAPEAPIDSSLTHSEFGIDIGGDSSVEALRALWTTVRAQHGALLDGLRPTISLHDSGRQGVELRLVVGPLANAAAAARLCAVIASTGRSCQPSGFDGARAALR